MVPNKIERDPIYFFDEVIKLVHDAADEDKVRFKYKVYHFLLILHLIIQIISNHNARLYS